jgi:HEPN domain-containing protein
MKEITKAWFEFAKQDLKDAEILLKNRSTKGCVWHCHQAIEKILKAIIIEKGKRPRKIHDLIELLKEANVKLPKELSNFIEGLNFFN